MPTPGLTLPVFAHFVLINSTLSSILCLSGAHATSMSDPSPGQSDVLRDKTRDFSLQYTLHNWLQGWVRAPDGQAAPEKADQEPLFTRNAMPYYWLAQATLVAMQEDVSGKPGFFVSPETRFRVLGQWLVHIRNFMRSSQSDSAGLWIQLMKIISEDGHGARTGAEGMQALRPDL
jgi:hypothetical protein